jgi:hypothetical protein
MPGDIFYTQVDTNLQEELTARSLAGYNRTNRDINYMVGKLANAEIRAYDGPEPKGNPILTLGGVNVRDNHYQPSGDSGFLNEVTDPAASQIRRKQGIEWNNLQGSERKHKGSKFTPTDKTAVLASYKRGNVQKRIPPYIVNTSISTGDHSMALFNNATIVINIPNIQRDLDTIEQILLRPGRAVSLHVNHPPEAIITDKHLTSEILPSAEKIKKLYDISDEQVQQKLTEISKMNQITFEGVIVNFDLNIQTDYTALVTITIRGTTNIFTDVSMIMNNTEETTPPVEAIIENEDDDLNIEEEIFTVEEIEEFQLDDELKILEKETELQELDELENEPIEELTEKDLKKLDRQDKKRKRQQKLLNKIKPLLNKIKKKINVLKQKRIEGNKFLQKLENKRLEKQRENDAAAVAFLNFQLAGFKEIDESELDDELAKLEESEQKLLQQETDLREKFENAIPWLKPNKPMGPQIGIETEEEARLFQKLLDSRESSLQFYDKLVTMIDVCNRFQTISQLLNTSDIDAYGFPEFELKDDPSPGTVPPTVPPSGSVEDLDENMQLSGNFSGGLVTPGTFAAQGQVGALSKKDRTYQRYNVDGILDDTGEIDPVETISVDKITQLPPDHPYQQYSFWATGLTYDVLQQDYTIKQRELLDVFESKFRICPSNYEEDDSGKLKHTDQWFLQGDTTPDSDNGSMSGWSQFITLGTLIQFINDEIVSLTDDVADDAKIICSDQLCYSNYLPNLVSINPTNVLLIPNDNARGTTEKYGSTIFLKDILGTHEGESYNWPGYYGTIKDIHGAETSIGFPSRIFLNVDLIENYFMENSKTTAAKVTVNHFLEYISNIINNATAGAVLMKLITHPDPAFNNQLLYYDANYAGNENTKAEVTPYIIPMTARITNINSDAINNMALKDPTPEGTTIGTIVRDFSFSAKMPANVQALTYTLNQKPDDISEDDIAPYLNVMYSQASESTVDQMNKTFRRIFLKGSVELEKAKIDFGKESSDTNKDKLDKALKKYIQLPAEGPAESLKVVSPIFPFEVSFTIDGINGFRYGDVLNFDILPSNYRINTVCVVKDITHTITQENEWYTQINCFMRPRVGV